MSVEACSNTDTARRFTSSGGCLCKAFFPETIQLVVEPAVVRDKAGAVLPDSISSVFPYLLG